MGLKAFSLSSTIMKHFLTTFLLLPVSLGMAAGDVLTLPDTIQKKTQQINPEYIWFTPESKEEKPPLIVFLHGKGQRGSNIKTSADSCAPKSAGHDDLFFA